MERTDIWLHLTLAGFANLGNGDIDPAPGEVHGQRQADRPRADDQHCGFNCAIHPFAPLDAS